MLIRIFAVSLVLGITGPVEAQELPADRPIYAQVADAVMERNPDEVYVKWDYISGLMLQAIEQVGRRTGDQRFLDYVTMNMEHFIEPDGNIPTYRLEEFNIDHINQGKVLFLMMERSDDERYRRAADTLREQMRRHPRTSEGGFWHKNIYPHQLWLDGIYMASPYLAQYALEFDEPELFDDVAHQVLLIARHTRDPKTGLFYHAWDESRSMLWADSVTGLSSNFWGRALGWYAMAIVDVLDFLPEDHKDRDAIIHLFQGLARAVADVQDPVTGLWYQVLDKPNREPNYREISASSMFTYAFAKGARLGYLEPEYRSRAERTYDSIVSDYLRVDDDGFVSLHGIVEVAGLGGRQQRDGSFEYYMSEPVVANDYKGVGPFIFASLELEE